MGNLNRRVERVEQRIGKSKAKSYEEIPEPATLKDAMRIIQEILSDVEERMRNGQPLPDPPAEDDPVTLELRALLSQALRDAENRPPSE
jgi:hypothetical protein